jgi:nitrate/nitrite transport system substrate-binding protein
MLMDSQDSRANPGPRPERGLPRVRVGFMPLADCASIVLAAELGFDRRHGVSIAPIREASWAGVRDKLVSGDLDMAQALYGLIYGVHLGLGGPRRNMAVLMTLNQNGQGITLARSLAEQGAVDAASLARLIATKPRTYTFAQTFPTGTHAMWLYYWLAAAGVHPLRDVQVLTVPPPQMVAHMRAGNVDGFSAGEPWNQRAILDGIGVHAASSQDVWPDHPEKVLGATSEFVAANADVVRSVMMAVLEASRWIDASEANRTRAAEILSRPEYVNTPASAILPRMLGRYEDGLGRSWTEQHAVRFFSDGEVNFPYLSDGMWFLTQYRRWGLLRDHPDYLAVASQINRIDLYRDAAGSLGIPLPDSSLRSSRLMDGVLWDGRQPAAYADAFAVRTPEPSAAHA